MTHVSNIWLLVLAKVRTLTGAKFLFGAIVLSFFVYGQAAWASHGHDHDHDNDSHQTSCAFCVLTTSAKEVVADDLDLSDESVLLSRASIGISAAFKAQTVPTWQFDSEPKQLLPDKGYDSVRAPPYQ